LEPLIERLLPYGMPTTSMVLSTPVYRQQEAWLLKDPELSRRPIED
jgi:Lrp/AsnC family transcriptional regulator, leucine-responsive regulatory protein